MLLFNKSSWHICKVPFLRYCNILRNNGRSASSGIATSSAIMEGVDVLNVVTSVYELNVSDIFQSVQK